MLVDELELYQFWWFVSYLQSINIETDKKFEKKKNILLIAVKNEMIFNSFLC